MKLFKLSVLLLALGMGACESGFPTEPGGPVVCKENDPRDICMNAVEQEYPGRDGSEKGDENE